ncbi:MULTISPECIES: GPO family capsid scaffolding protein [unclassified Pseudoalteromonas]|uniref:GPO family capsid scaffolding protein n=1 Tax=unclassified Pseudoalteromonas TaxID=194690 RepID=UPI0025B40BD8|nr:MULTISPECIES: GPO family capsid scaffolding protein [unclassified Pseudoalteromonas]MDN3394586.1 GPO family capsid scaffolding protein [Pseudoalteromonas sp. APC 3215]MDN3469646.1 GPO family capsid scaffolding protein [Pseudoalteromonas sp. APC 4026]
MAKQSGWVIAATEGATVDGRTISKEWITQMAASYSVDEYTALIWPEHFRSSWGPSEGKNWGTVDEVKAAKQGGKLRLFVKITANDYLLAANKDGQKLFMSIEPNPDYKSEGRCYLQGLAVTDSPASSGTSRLKFSIGDNEVNHEYSQLETLQHSDFITTNSEPTTPNSKQAKAQSLMAQLFSLFSSDQQPADQQDEITEEDTMKQEQFEALMGKFDGLETKVTDLEKKFSKPPKAEETPPVEEPKDDEPESDKAAAGVTAEQFSQLMEKVDGFSKKVDGIETKFNALSEEQKGQEPDPVGGETVDLV